MLKPSQLLENTIKIINQAFNYAGVNYWLSFGGLYGLIRNDGIIPDGDFDLCTNYGVEYKQVEKSLQNSPARYKTTKVMTNDVDSSKILYCSFTSESNYPHLCLSFWYKHNGVAYYCHDQYNEIEGVMAPKTGYYFKGVPEDCINDFRLVEWPGINQGIKIRVPRFPGRMLDNMYPDWAYRIQKYNIQNHEVQKDRMVSYHKGGATSPYVLELKSMADFNNEKLISSQLAKSKSKWDITLKQNS